MSRLARTCHTRSAFVRRRRLQPAGKERAGALLQKAQAGGGQQVAKAGCRCGGALEASAVGHLSVALHLEKGAGRQQAAQLALKQAGPASALGSACLHTCRQYWHTSILPVPARAAQDA